ncbi:MAG: TlpA family protein disulfide reductase [Deltaproteobacteria bacterium]|nr:TlpA family protein disulfide reductase [Deltaproteobacteria bacterium]
MPTWWPRVKNFVLVAAALLIVVVFAPRMCRKDLLEPGSPAPTFSLTLLLEHGRLTLGDLRGKPAVLFFWAVWCPYCKKMLPGLDALAGERPDTRFVAVHSDPQVDPADVEHSARRFPGLTHTLDGERILGSYRVDTFPSTYVIDAQGKICAGFVGTTSSDSVAHALDNC